VMFDELERFVTAHRPCGELTAAVDEPTEIGYDFQLACSLSALSRSEQGADRESRRGNA
jgi:hypothetical protein